MKRVIRLNESELHRIISETANRFINEIGDTRRGQYMLGKLWRKKYDDEYAKGTGDSAYKAAEPIRKYAGKNNRKSIDGHAAFDAGTHAKWNEEFRNSELAKKGKTKRKSEADIYQSLADKDAKENVMEPDDIYRFAIEWLKSHEKMVLRYKGDSYNQERLSRCGCKNLGDYIIYCYKEDKVPGWMFYQIYANKIYKELNLFYDGSTANSDELGFGRAWEEFCGYIYNRYGF